MSTYAGESGENVACIIGLDHFLPDQKLLISLRVATPTIMQDGFGMEVIPTISFYDSVHASLSIY